MVFMFHSYVKRQASRERHNKRAVLLTRLSEWKNTFQLGHGWEMKGSEHLTSDSQVHDNTYGVEEQRSAGWVHRQAFPRQVREAPWERGS